MTKVEIKRENYRKTTSFVAINIVGIICIICLAGVLLWQPQPKLKGEPTEMSTTQDTPIYIYNREGRLVESDKVIPEGTDLTVIGEFAEYKWCVEDEAGNRFAVNKAHLFGDPSLLKAINPSYGYVYKGLSLNGQKLTDISDKAGDYIYAAVDSGYYVFPQIVLAEGKDRYKGVFLCVDENGIVTDTKNLHAPQSNLYTRLPFFDRIVALNLINKFTAFNTDADMDAYDTFSLEKVGSDIKDFFGNIFSYILLAFVGLIVAAIAVAVTFGAGNFFFQYLGRLTRLKNGVIATLEYAVMIPCCYIVVLSLLYMFNSVWMLLALFVTGFIYALISIIENFSIRDARCPKCLKLNTTDVEAITYANGADIEAQRTSGGKLNEAVEVDTVRPINHFLVEEHLECSSCHHIRVYESTYDETGEWQNIAEVACPHCGKLSLRATSTITKDTIRYVVETRTKRGDLHYEGKNVITGDLMFTSKDRTTTYGHYRGYRLYKKIVTCTECDYCHSVEERYEPDSSSTKLSDGTQKSKWKARRSLFD